MRVLFLDFDGPLHPTEAIEGLRPGLTTISQAARERNLFRWLPRLEALLADHPDVGLVVHSAWRAYASNSEIRDILGSLGERLLGVTSVELDRYEGILQTVRRFGIERYIILDDAVEKFPQGLPELCVADPQRGLEEATLRDQISRWLSETSSELECAVPATNRQ